MEPEHGLEHEHEDTPAGNSGLVHDEEDVAVGVESLLVLLHDEV